MQPKAVEDRAAGILQTVWTSRLLFCFVEAGAQLDHGHDFLAVFCSGNQRIDGLRVAGHAAGRHFNGDGSSQGPPQRTAAWRMNGRMLWYG